jgi:hypothetical protein
MVWLLYIISAFVVKRRKLPESLGAERRVFGEFSAAEVSERIAAQSGCGNNILPTKLSQSGSYSFKPEFGRLTKCRFN